MKVFATSLLVGVAAAAVSPLQQPMQFPQQFPEAAKQTWSSQLNNVLKTLTSEAAAIWDEIALLYPEDMSKASFFSTPKKHNRRPDHEWDHIVRGREVQRLWVDNAEGEKERELSGKLETYDLRVKTVDPSAIGVDPAVKQYSGYLDDNENDKHLFYCEISVNPLDISANRLRVLRITKRSKERSGGSVAQWWPWLLVSHWPLPRTRTCKCQ